MVLSKEEAQEVQAHIEKVSAILYKNTPPAQLTSLEGIEQAIRQHLLAHVSPQMAVFLLKKQQEQQQDEPGTSKVI